MESEVKKWGQEDVRPTDTGYELSDAALAEVMQISFEGGGTVMTGKMTWGYIKEWAEVNKVADDAVVSNTDTGEYAIDLSFTPENEIDPAEFSIDFGDVDE